MNDLEQIKEILFGNEKKALNALLRRLETPESRTADVADVLPDAVTRSYNRGPRLRKALSQPVEATLSDAIRREPKKFADALFPVMGPAIRKAIAEALKSMLQSMNNAIDTSLSPTARFKAWRAGVPLAEWVLRKNIVYRVDEVYLIDPRSGLLIEHVHHQDVSHQDEDAVSAMLTAIQDFVKDSFAADASGGLDSAVIGEYTVWLSQGPYAMLACVIRGLPPTRLQTEIRAANERIHLHHSGAMSEFSGSTGTIAGLDAELGELLRVQQRDTTQPGERSGLSPALVIALLALLSVMVFFGGRSWITGNKLNRLESLIGATSGIITTDASHNDGIITLAGLRDPLAPDPAVLAESVGIKPQKLQLYFQTFQSLEPAIIEQRVQRILATPDSARAQMRGDTLVVSGFANAAWRAKLDLLAPAIGGVAKVDTSGLQADDQSLELQLREVLMPDENTDVSVTKGIAIFSGVAPLAWHEKLATIPDLVPGVVAINKSNLAVAERAELQKLHAQIDGQTLTYAANVEPEPGQEVKLVNLAAQLQRYAKLSSALNLPGTVQIIGYADGTGNPAVNTVVKARRANDFRQRLIQLGVDPSWLRVDSAALPETAETDLSMRKAVLRLPVHNY